MTQHSWTAGLGENDVFLTRTLDAPRELVWQIFTQADHLARWWGPQGCSTRVLHLDLRPGGLFHYAMTAPNGTSMWGKFVYREVVAPESLAFVLSFADSRANTVRAPFSATWPLEVLSQNLFTEAEGKTTVTMAAAPFNATEEERTSFAAGRESLKQGTNGSFEQLIAYLKSLS